MKSITVDARMINSSGIGTVIQNVLKQLIPADSDIRFYLLGNPREIDEHGLTAYKNVKVISCDIPIYSIKEQLSIPKLVPRDSALLWVPHYNIPVFYSGKLLVTVHDVFHLAMPQFVKGIHKRMYAHLLFGKVAQKASKIICVSQFSADELKKYTGVSSKKIQIVYNGVDSFWSEPLKDEKKIHDKPYLLFVGNVKPHKNLLRLIKAFDSIKDKIPHDLVIVGKKEGFITGDQEVARYAEKLGNRVVFTGFVSNEELKNYYAYADLFVFPSLYEGFGLPPLEAMAAGCQQVLCSDIPVLHEIYENTVKYFDPYNVNEIAQSIVDTLDTESGLMTVSHEDLIAGYNWKTTAEKYNAVIKEILKK